MATITVNGTRLYYEIEGTSDMPVVLVHGSWGSHHNWDAVAPALSRSFRLLTYDRRGHSQSARPTSQGSLLEDAMDLAALLEALEMVPAHIVGNSGGAAVALRLATERP
ncbi:MAG TPA: alpha/beta hydrolase, partial [Gemmatimonadaceae bacterium]|nr:alpha/beta hydrolase [Gemmatimonadaceae bacterium]